MSAQDNEAVLRKSIQAYNDRDWDKALECCTEDSNVIDIPTGQTYRGRAGWLEFLQNAVKAFPDSTLTLTNVVANDQFVATQCIFRGTHTGSLTMPQGEMSPTGRSVEVQAAGFFPFVNGKIAEYRRYSDVMAFLSQIGVVLKPEYTATEQASQPVSIREQ
jgi:steroid delta-isomerase-like uncharacterized protein